MGGLLSLAQGVYAVQANINSGNPAFPFPQFMDYGEDRKSLASHNAPGVTHAEMEQRCRDAWQHICNNVTEEGTVVDGVPYLLPDVLKATGHCTCVEGDGYYLLGAAIMADQDFFNGYYMWTHDRAFRGVKRFNDGGWNDENYMYSKGLSGAGSFGAATTIGSGWNGNSATDGDVDVAMALLMAYKQWGEHSGVTTAIGELNYKEEALKYIRAMVDTAIYAGALPEIKYVTGDVGLDGYLKNGDSWGELTQWGATNGYHGIPDQNGGGTMVYFDYSAPAYFNEYRRFLELDSKSTEWQMNQCRRCEVSSDWLMGQLYKQSETAIPVCGHVSVVGDDGKFTFAGNGPFAEDMRAGWRTILNYLWHGDPEYSWDPTTHEAIKGSNSYEKDMALRFGKFLANPQGNHGIMSVMLLVIWD